ncbi:unnamed protein product [Camellia sinensis]
MGEMVELLTERSCSQTREQKGMSSANASGDFSSEMEVDAFRGLFPLHFHEHHLLESIRPDTRKLGKAKDITLALGSCPYLSRTICNLGAVASADGSALAKIGFITMLVAIKMEVMTPTTESPDKGCIVISKTYTIWMLMVLFLMLHNLQQLLPSLIVQIPVVSLNDDGRVVVVSKEDGGKLKYELVNKGKRKLKLSSVPFFLTCILHKNYILAYPTTEEESIMESLVTVVLDSSFHLVSLNKPGGPVLAYTLAIQDSISEMED